MENVDDYGWMCIMENVGDDGCNPKVVALVYKIYNSLNFAENL